MKVRVLKLKNVNSKISRSRGFRGSLTIPIITSSKFCEKVLFFANHGHLQELKVCDLKLSCPSQLHGLKDRKISRNINWKKKIGDWGNANVLEILTRWYSWKIYHLVLNNYHSTHLLVSTKEIIIVRALQCDQKLAFASHFCKMRVKIPYW
jgi:hypothetical protein